MLFMICNKHVVYLEIDTQMFSNGLVGKLACATCVEERMVEFEGRLKRIEEFAQQQAKTNIDVSQMVFPHRVIGGPRGRVRTEPMTLSKEMVEKIKGKYPSEEPSEEEDEKS